MMLEGNVGGGDYFGFYASELVGLLGGCKDTQLPSAEEQGRLFSHSIGASLPDLIRERLHSLLRQTVTVLSKEVDQVLDPVFSICQLKKECFKYRITLEDAPLCNSNASAPVESSHAAIKKEDRQIDGELQLLLQSDSSEVEKVMKRHADEYQAKIEHMESMLEKLLHIITSTCRSMTRPEKHTLKKLIGNLPPKNLERIAEIIQHSRPVIDTPSAEMHIDLEKEDNVTLWRLYYYVKAVEKAQQQCVTDH